MDHAHHLVWILAASATLAVYFLVDAKQVSSPSARVDRPRLVVGTASGVAAGIHLAAAPGHLDHGVLHVGFFAALGLAQAALALLSVRSPGWLLRRLVLLVHGPALALWLLTRSAGLPGEAPLAVGVLDVAASIAELAAVASALLWSSVAARNMADPSGHLPYGVATGLAASLSLGLVLAVVAGQPHRHAPEGYGALTGSRTATVSSADGR